MGGDHAPEVVVDGAVQAARELGVAVTLVGRDAVVRPLALRAAGGERELAALSLVLEDAPDVVGMDELPLPATRRKKQSSIMVGLRLVRDGRADAFVSAGNTGAVMAAATLVLRTIPGVERPALAAMLPNRKGGSVLLDVGANVDVKAQHLEQFAVMGSCFVRAVKGIETPRVALLSVGEEEVKGNDLIRRVHQDLKKGPVNFIGNIDGKDVYSGHADVIVTDGFTGNAILKSSESLLRELVNILRGELRGSLRARLGYLLLEPVSRRLRRVVDHSEYGAVPLLGVGGPVFIGHGSSSAKSIRSALRVAKTFVEARVNEAIERKVREMNEAAASVEARRDAPGAQDPGAEAGPPRDGAGSGGHDVGTVAARGGDA
jgi:glycerol-3-phosphate acyltransferase PlsX